MVVLSLEALQMPNPSGHEKGDYAQQEITATDKPQISF
jgi:hypothetical protein